MVRKAVLMGGCGGQEGMGLVHCVDTVDMWVGAVLLVLMKIAKVSDAGERA